MSDADTLRRLIASHNMLTQTPVWHSTRHNRIFKVYSVATMLLAGSEDGAVRIHPATIADAVGAKRDSVVDDLRALDAAGVLSWDRPRGSSDLGTLAFAPDLEPEDDEPTPTVEQVIARAKARDAEVDAGQSPELARHQTALEAFGEARPAYETDRDERRG